MRGIFVCLAVVLGLVGTFNLGAEAAPGGSSANAALCGNDGWRTLTDADGTPFKNQGQCVRFGAQGGVLTPPSLTPTVRVTEQRPDQGFTCIITVEVTGFPAGAQLEFIAQGEEGGIGRIVDDQLTDSNGAGVFVDVLGPAIGPTIIGAREFSDDSSSNLNDYPAQEEVLIAC